MDHIKAGTETTGWTLTYVVYELSRRPGLQRTLQEELKRIDMPFYSPETKYLDEEALTTVSPSPQALDALPLLSAVIHETLRRYPAVPGPQPRITPTNSLTTVPTNLGNSVIPGGIRVSAQAYSLHRNESVFPAPEEWHPWRWIDANEDQKAQMNKWLWAFGSGSRMCIGKDFALMGECLSFSHPHARNDSPAITTREIQDLGVREFFCCLHISFLAGTMMLFEIQSWLS